MGSNIQGMFAIFYSIIGFLVFATILLAVLWGLDRRKRRKD